MIAPNCPATDTVGLLYWIQLHYTQGRPIGKESIKAYCQTLREIPFDLLKAAAQKAVLESEFFPTVAKLRKAALEILEVQESPPGAAEEWEWVCEWIGSSGAGRPREGHELAERAVAQIGGWDSLGRGTVDARHFRRKEFVDTYNGLRNAALREMRMGTAEREILYGREARSYLELKGMERLGESGAVKQVLAQARAGAPQKALPAPSS